MDRIAHLVSSLDALVEQEQRAQRDAVTELLDTAQALQGRGADRRVVLLVARLKQLRERLDLLGQMVRDDFLAKISRELEQEAPDHAGDRALAIAEALAAERPRSLGGFCSALLDRLVDATGAERGFVLFYVPESSEADVVAARNFETRNLSLDEYGFSRTILRQVLERRAPLVLDDAVADPDYVGEASVHRLSLRSVLAVPIARGARTIGAVYLENNSAPKVFSAADARVAATAARFAALHLAAARLLPVFEREGRVLLDAARATSEIAGNAPAIRAVLETIDRIADSPAAVLVEGESGTGKELVARALHYRSNRRDHPFVAINCAAIPEHLVESELFGHERGAFTGAVERLTGRFEQADRGTLFLDEVGDLAYPLQAKLLRVLQSHEFQRLGGRETIRVDVRLVAATSKDLRALIREGTFLEALYYRVHVVPIALPPLRERRDDVPLLVERFLDRYSATYGRRMRVDADALARLAEYEWPGNVRELENVVHRLVALALDDVVRVGDLPPEVLQDRAERVSLARVPFGVHPVDLGDLRRQRDAARRYFQEQERLLVEQAVRDADGNVTEAAARLGMHRVTLHKLLRQAPGKADHG
jgi:Nif-specific regulatory protein